MGGLLLTRKLKSDTFLIESGCSAVSFIDKVPNQLESKYVILEAKKWKHGHHEFYTTFPLINPNHHSSSYQLTRTHLCLTWTVPKVNASH